MRRMGLLILVGIVYICIASPRIVEAKADVPENIVNYRLSKTGDLFYSTSFSISGLHKNAKIYPKSLKSSKNSVITPSYFKQEAAINESKVCSYEFEEKLIKYNKPDISKQESYTALIGYYVLDTGKATLRYKIGANTYKTAVTTLDYTNPLKTVKITGINNGKNIATMLNNRFYADAKLSKTQKNASIYISVKSNWVIKAVFFDDSESGKKCSITNVDNFFGDEGTRNVKMNLGTLTKDKPAEVWIQLYNTKSKAYQGCYYYINQ